MPLLDRLNDAGMPKGAFGVSNALAVIAYLVRAIDGGPEWNRRLVTLLDDFPASSDLPLASLGVPDGWHDLELWCPADARTLL